MKPPYPSPTPTWHNDTYEGINPKALDGAHSGKTTIIVGAGSGIGRATAIAFAEAGAGALHLLGRKKSTLEETQKLIPDNVKSTVRVIDITHEDEVEKLAAEIGRWDVLVLSHGGIQKPAPVVEMSIKAHWSSYEANVKSLIIAAHAFVPRAKEGAFVVAFTSGSIAVPVTYTLGQADYQVSKLAQIKTIEYLAAENPAVSFFAVHPGLIETKIFSTVGHDPKTLPMDKPELPAHFTTWLTSPKGKFLNGRMVFANWDVAELEGMKEEISPSLLMTIGYVGWPFTNIDRDSIEAA